MSDSFQWLLREFANVIDLIQQFIKQEINIKWLALSDYNTIAWLFNSCKESHS